MEVFQSTRPVWGATFILSSSTANLVISIHAPRVGRDGVNSSAVTCATYFNPRAPCGARPDQTCSSRHHVRFQSTRPVWGATLRYYGFTINRSRFQSTRPVWGATWKQIDDVIMSDFNPRAPCGARQAKCSTAARRKLFQSTRPVWGATAANFANCTYEQISIHAPRVGRDAH